MEICHRIGIIDDDTAVRDSTHLLLEAYGFQVSEYASATDYLKNSRTDCLLLIDLALSLGLPLLVDSLYPGPLGQDLAALDLLGAQAALLNLLRADTGLLDLLGALTPQLRLLRGDAPLLRRVARLGGAGKQAGCAGEQRGGEGRSEPF